MAAALKLTPKLTPQEYLAFERKAEFKSEYMDGQLVAMAGANRHHNRCNENLSGEIHLRLKGHSCQSFSRDCRVLVERTNSYFYPDVVIACGPLEFLDSFGDVLLNPSVIVEVLSPSTQNTDSGKKFLHYQRIPTLQEYVLVDPSQPIVHHYIRQPSGAAWEVRLLEGLDATLELQTASLAIPLAAIYDRIDFSGPEPILAD